MDGLAILIELAIFCGSFAGFGYWVATRKRRPPAEGAVLGFLFGPVGVLVEALLPTGDIRPRSRSAPVADPLAALGLASTPRQAPRGWELPTTCRADADDYGPAPEAIRRLRF